ncbi:two-component response regulator-like APRR1 [Andrographis paniculata]|uniref:two-component response regulator-like APRR1 n=1 Tax=Andrographis paniculata TaxID=175694 RepID=UPI0021E99E00|nr:two-component response regulator-like APRR1 [Andrographis paniculata]
MEKSGDGFVDRSKVRILLCDNDEKSSAEVFTLLCKCSYQVTSVKSPRQVIDALNAEGPDIDIILSEVDLPMSKGLKMLKYIMRDKELRRIPVIMMSAQDEVSIVVKCLKFGAADYLVKPLRTNELLNLWTHMWRRRRMLGLAEKNIVNYDFDPLVSDPSDANTNSTTLFSDDTDDKSRKSTNPDACASTHPENEHLACQNNVATAAVSVETASETPSECQPDLRIRDHGSPFPKKSGLRIGESSAFFTYIKSSMHENAPRLEKTVEEHMDIRGKKDQDFRESQSQPDEHPSNNTVPDSSFSMERSSTPQISNPAEISQQHLSGEQFSHPHLHESPSNAPNHYPYPFYMPSVMNQVTMPPASMYHNHHIPQCPPHIPAMASYPYYPYGICLQPGQMPVPPPHPWPSSLGNSSNEGNCPSKVDRREAALIKFRQKRKERCFDKKIRYVNRKKLAERRPRLRGQFMRKVNGVNVDLNGQPASAEEDEEEEDYEEEDQSNISSMDDASTCL